LRHYVVSHTFVWVAWKDRQTADFPIEPDTYGAYFPDMKKRVARHEEEMQDVKSLLSRLEPMIIRIDATLASTLPHLATKAEAVEGRNAVGREIADLGVELHQSLSNLPTKTYLWSVMGVLITAYAAGLAVLAVVR
jgi:hypothetical protein